MPRNSSLISSCSLFHPCHFSLWILKYWSFIRTFLPFISWFFTRLYFLNNFPKKSILIIHLPLRFFVKLLILIFFACLINFISKMVVNIFDTFSVGKLWLIFIIRWFLPYRWNISYKFNRCRKRHRWFDWRYISCWSSTSNRRSCRVHVIDILTFKWRFIELKIWREIFMEVVWWKTLLSLHWLILFGIGIN